ncbi:MAG: hypothetical protein Ct9H300mP28_03280 [Pseudomonadota bacterium]|nr:MAG: hypothetical protein Ct9H300mP28_03280 [Pseudomonadota bacterium]
MEPLKLCLRQKTRGRLIEAHMEEPHFAAVVEPITENVFKGTRIDCSQ